MICLLLLTGLPLVTSTGPIVLTTIFTRRVAIRVTDEGKHTLPVDGTCLWHHPLGLAKHEVGCYSADGDAAKNFFDIWLCMEQAACTINGVLQPQTMLATIVVAVLVFLGNCLGDWMAPHVRNYTTKC